MGLRHSFPGSLTVATLFTMTNSPPACGQASICGKSYDPVPYQPNRIPVEESLRKAADLRRHMETRRSVRMFSTDPVPEQALLDAIATASSAPSGVHQQPWTFVLVTDSEVRQKIRNTAEEEERISYSGRLGAEWLSALRPLGTVAVKPHLSEAPHLIVVFQQRFFLAGDGSTRKHYYVSESVGIAVGMRLPRCMWPASPRSPTPQRR